jgi:hypothetical protein
MFFRTESECLELVQICGFAEADFKEGSAAKSSAPSLRVTYEGASRGSVVIARSVASWLAEAPSVFLWLTEWGIWSRWEDMNLYYRLRRSYGDLRALHEAPGHVFLDFERADLISFLGLVIGYGWGGYLMAGPASPRATFSHDGWMRVWPGTEEEQIVRDVESLELPWRKHKTEH